MTSMQIIRRYAKSPLDLRHLVEEREDGGTDEAYAFEGHASVFGQETLIGSKRFGFIEEVKAGAFADVLEDDVRFLVNHAGLPLARTTNGTLGLSEDKIGLLSKADLAPTSLTRDLDVLLRREDVDQMSFAFTISGEEWTTVEDGEFEGLDKRTITKMDRLYDVSVVTYPAYDGTDAGMRLRSVSDEEIAGTLREVHGEAEALARLQDARRDLAIKKHHIV